MAKTDKDKALFNKEICAVVAILLIFTGSYIVTAICSLTDIDITDLDDGFVFAGMLEYLLVKQLCDFITIMLLLVFHYRNFRERKEESID